MTAFMILVDEIDVDVCEMDVLCNRTQEGRNADGAEI